MPDRSEENTGKSPELHLDEDLCMDLLNGLLPAEEVQRTLAHMDECPSCEAFVRARVSELERSRSQIEEVRDRLKMVADRKRGAEGSFLDRFFAELRRSLRRRPVQVGAALAAVIIAVLLILPQLQQSPYEPELIVLPDISADLRFRADDESPFSIEFTSGLRAYNRGDFPDAVGILKKARATDAYAAIKDVYLGSALAWCGRYEEAVNILRPLSSEVLPELWDKGFRWTYLVALYQTGHSSIADSLAQLLAAEEDAFGERARQYLGR
jgi:hypothetical protein